MSDTLSAVSVAVAGSAPEDDKIAELMQTGDVSTLAPEQRGQYLLRLCQRLGLNPFSRPFDFLQLKGPDGKMRTILYANRVASDQLRFNHKIEYEVVYEGPFKIGDIVRSDIYCVDIDIKLPITLDGTTRYRVERHVGCVAIGAYQGDKLILLTGEAMANARMKCFTKAVRRGTLSIVGLGLPDETEVVDLPSRSSPSAPTQQQDTQPLPRILTPEGLEEKIKEVTEAYVPPPAFPRPLPAAKPPVR